nr:hypothetical protein [Roseomonas rubea]
MLHLHLVAPEICLQRLETLRALRPHHGVLTKTDRLRDDRYLFGLRDFDGHLHQDLARDLIADRPMAFHDHRLVLSRDLPFGRRLSRGNAGVQLLSDTLRALFAQRALARGNFLAGSNGVDAP